MRHPQCRCSSGSRVVVSHSVCAWYWVRLAFRRMSSHLRPLSCSSCPLCSSRIYNVVVSRNAVLSTRPFYLPAHIEDVRCAVRSADSAVAVLFLWFSHIAVTYRGERRDRTSSTRSRRSPRPRTSESDAEEDRQSAQVASNTLMTRSHYYKRRFFQGKFLRAGIIYLLCFLAN